MRIVAHDIQNPAAAALQYARLAGKKPNQTVQRTISQLVRLKATINNVLAFASDRVRILPEHKKYLTIQEIRNFVEEQFHPVAQAKKIKLIWKQHNSSIQFFAEPDSFFNHILGNLVSNALRHAPEKSRLLIQATLTDNYTVLSITNRGEGISPEGISRSLSGNQVRQGYGISIAKKFAILNDLEITWFSAKLGNLQEEGTTVEIRQKKNFAG